MNAEGFVMANAKPQPLRRELPSSEEEGGMLPGMKAWALILFLAITLPAANAIDPTKVVDLTHSFDANTIYWPTEKGFQWERGAWGRTPGGYFYASARFSSAEHGGTHIDSPLHFAEGQPSVDQLTMRQLIGPAIVIDVSEACAKDADYLVSPADLSNRRRFRCSGANYRHSAVTVFRNGINIGECETTCPKA